MITKNIKTSENITKSLVTLQDDLDYIVSKKGFEDDSKRYTNMLFQNKRISVQATRYTKDQKAVPVNARGILVEHNNEAIGAYGIYTDISDIKKSQTLLMESEKKSRAIINALPDITFIIDKKGIVADFNSPDDDFFYADKDKMKANNLFDLVPE